VRSLQTYYTVLPWNAPEGGTIGRRCSRWKRREQCARAVEEKLVEGRTCPSDAGLQRQWMHMWATLSCLRLEEVPVKAEGLSLMPSRSRVSSIYSFKLLLQAPNTWDSGLREARPAAGGARLSAPRVPAHTRQRPAADSNAAAAAGARGGVRALHGVPP
jgi:hypothetical protein